MNIGFIQPTGCINTVIYDVGKWYDNLDQNEDNVDFIEFNSLYWESLTSEKIFILVENSKNEQRIRDMFKPTREALDMLTCEEIYLNADKYIDTLKRLIDYLILLNNSQDQYSFDLSNGVKVSGLNYKDSDEITKFVHEDSSYYRFIYEIVIHQREYIDTAFLQVFSEPELVNSLLVSRALKKLNPDVYLSLIEFSFENFSLRTFLSKLKVKNAFLNIYDSIIEDRINSEYVCSEIVENLRDGNVLKGYLNGTDRIMNNNTLHKKIKRLPILKSYNYLPVYCIRLFDIGCSWGKCTFCAQNNKNSKVEGKQLNIDYEYAIERLINLYESGYKHFIFLDETLPVNVLKRLSKLIISKQLEIKWTCRTRITYDQDLNFFTLLKGAGCYEILYGLETVSSRVITLMKKYEEFDRIKTTRLFDDLSKAGISAHINIIIGFPGENKSDVEETVDFMIEVSESIKNITYQLNRFGLMTGSKIFNEPDTYDIFVNETNDDMCVLRDFEYKTGDYKNTENLSAFVNEMKKKVYNNTGWKEIGDYRKVSLAMFFYSNTGHSVTFKTDKHNIFSY